MGSLESGHRLAPPAGIPNPNLEANIADKSFEALKPVVAIVGNARSMRRKYR